MYSSQSSREQADPWGSGAPQLKLPLSFRLGAALSSGGDVVVPLVARGASRLLIGVLLLAPVSVSLPHSLAWNWARPAKDKMPEAL